jgi:hypothetical protein
MTIVTESVETLLCRESTVETLLCRESTVETLLCRESTTWYDNHTALNSYKTSGLLEHVYKTGSKILLCYKYL